MGDGHFYESRLPWNAEIPKPCDVKPRLKPLYGQWRQPRVPSDVAQVFDVESNSALSFLESRRLEGVRQGKGSGAPAGAWPRHLPSAMERVIFGSDDTEAADAEEARRGKGSGWRERHMRSDVDRIVFGRDIDFSEGDPEDADVESWKRGKAGGGENGAWPRHMRSDVDRVVFGRDIDGSEAVEDAETTYRGKAVGRWPRHMRSEVDSVVFGRDIDGSDEVEAAEAAASSSLAVAARRGLAPPPSVARAARSVPLPPAAAPSSSVFARAAPSEYAPPSAEDLFALHHLYGGNRASIVRFLATQWRADPQLIAPSVHSWLEQMPPVEMLPLPSRSRSSPALPTIAKRRAAAEAPPGLTLERGMLSYADRRDVPAATAPVGAAPSAPQPPALACALSGLHSASARLNATSISGTHHSRRTQQRRSPHADVYTHHGGGADFSPVRLSPHAIAAVPEDTMLADDGDDTALRLLMSRARLRGEIAPDAQEARRSAATLARSWRMRT